MNALIYVLAAIGALYVLAVLVLYAKYRIAQRKLQKQLGWEVSVLTGHEAFGGETIELDPGDKPMAQDCYLESAPAGMHERQHDAGADSDLDSYSLLIGALAQQFREELEAEHPDPPKPEVEKSDDPDDEGVWERNHQRLLPWYAACEANAQTIKYLLDERLSPLGSASERELKKLLKPKPKSKT
jgi:hypothetical protein